MRSLPTGNGNPEHAAARRFYAGSCDSIVVYVWIVLRIEWPPLVLTFCDVHIRDYSTPHCE